MKKIVHKIKQNGIILLAALLFAIAIFYVKNNPDLFFSSILSLQEQQYITQQGRDAAYKTQSGSFEIFVASNYTGSLSKFQGIAYFDPDKIQMDTTTTTGQGEISIQKLTADTIKITVSNLSDIDTSREIVGIPFSGQQKQIILGESKGWTTEGQKAFSVGNLDEFTPHSK